MIFAAGLGTRFKPWTDAHPKALAPVNGKSLLQRNIEYLQRYGIRDVVVNVHHFAGQIVEAVKKNNGWGSRIHFSDESDELLDTGGGLLKAKDFFTPGERFITCNADILTDLSIHKLMAYHEEKKGLITFGVMNRKSSRYLLFDDAMKLCGWRNIVSGAERLVHPGVPASTQWKALAYSCVVVCEYDIFRLMQDKGFTGKFSMIDVYLTLAAGYPVYGYDHSGDRFADVGKPESIRMAESLFP